MRTEPPWDELDDGIRSTVRVLWDAGFEPIDSGDGRKADVMKCALRVPHVYMICEPAQLVSEARRLLDLVIFSPNKIALPSLPEFGPAVQAAYSPNDGVATLMLIGVTWSNK